MRAAEMERRLKRYILGLGILLGLAVLPLAAESVGNPRPGYPQGEARKRIETVFRGLLDAQARDITDAMLLGPEANAVIGAPGARLVVLLASGLADSLSGRYLSVDDFYQLLRRVIYPSGSHGTTAGSESPHPPSSAARTARAAASCGTSGRRG